MCASAYYLWDKNDAIFATVGDAVSSYMDRPDETTVGWCLMDFRSSRAWQSPDLSIDRQALVAKGSMIYQRKPRIRLFEAITKTRWWTTTALCVAYLSVGIFFLNLAWATMQDNGSSLKSIESNYGLGKVTNLNTMDTQFGPDQLSSSGTLIASVLFANSFQVGLSITYFLLNSLFTAQCSAMEWASYVSKRKPLRVTWPRGQQRSTYFLNLPYRYGIPLTVLMVALHFLISQSIFLARVQYFRPDGTKSDVYNISTTAYSPLGLLLVVCVASILILALVVHSFRKVDNRIPIHGNSSAVISALCHARKGRYRNDQDTAVKDCDKEMSEYPVQWGVVPSTNTAPDFQNDFDLTSKEGTTGHCAFTADEVDLPELGQRYR